MRAYFLLPKIIKTTGWEKMPYSQIYSENQSFQNEAPLSSGKGSIRRLGSPLLSAASTFMAFAIRNAL